MKKLIFVLLLVTAALAAPLITGQVIHKVKEKELKQNIFLPLGGGTNDNTIPIEHVAAAAVPTVVIAGYAINSYVKSKKPVVTTKTTSTGTVEQTSTGLESVTKQSRMSMTELESKGLFESVEFRPMNSQETTGVKKDEA